MSVVFLQNCSCKKRVRKERAPRKREWPKKSLDRWWKRVWRI